MAEGLHIGIHIAVPAARAAVGRVAALGAGRGRHGLLVLVAEGLGGSRLGLAAARAGPELLAALRAGRGGGLRPQQPAVAERGQDLGLGRAVRLSVQTGLSRHGRDIVSRAVRLAGRRRFGPFAPVVAELADVIRSREGGIVALAHRVQSVEIVAGGVRALKAAAGVDALAHRGVQIVLHRLFQVVKLRVNGEGDVLLEGGLRPDDHIGDPLIEVRRRDAAGLVAGGVRDLLVAGLHEVLGAVQLLEKLGVQLVERDVRRVLQDLAHLRQEGLIVVKRELKEKFLTVDVNRGADLVGVGGGPGDVHELPFRFLRVRSARLERRADRQGEKQSHKQGQRKYHCIVPLFHCFSLQKIMVQPGFPGPQNAVFHFSTKYAN